jgi:diadenosine tetraphosphatase ApaH/serine/threonine PP2A family protein phosphatase
MRVLVLTDIHANLSALDAVLEFVGDVDGTWVLGDTVGYGPDPDEVIARLAERGAVAVLGNHDAAAIGKIDTDVFNEDARAAILWTADRINPASRAWLGGLPETIERDGFTLAHGTPRDPLWEYCFSAPVARRVFETLNTPHAMVGHTHVPLLFREEDGRIDAVAPLDGSDVHIDERRVIVNPGGVGQPRDGDPRSCALILDLERMHATWLRIKYPVEPLQRRMRDHGLPERLVRRLEIGV